MSELLQSKSEAFLDRLRKDLSEAEQRYKDVSSNMEEYVSVRSFLTKELELDERQTDRRVTMNFGKQIYTSAKIKPNAKIFIRVQDDLFIEMPYERALKFVTKRLEFLNQIADDYLKEISHIKAHMKMTFAVMDPTFMHK